MEYSNNSDYLLDCLHILFFRKSSRNTWIGNIHDEIENLENEAILFWMSKNNYNDIQDIGKLTRKIKNNNTCT